jgi:hypothetical protein
MPKDVTRPGDLWKGTRYGGESTRRTPMERRMRESAEAEAIKESMEKKGELQGQKPELDRRASELRPLHDSIRNDLKMAFDAAKKYSNTTITLEKDICRALFVWKKKNIDSEMNNQYKPKRHALLGAINGLNEEIRRHNRDIETKRNLGQLKVDEYPKEKVPGDIEHWQSLDDVVRGRLWEQFIEPENTM